MLPPTQNRNRDDYRGFQPGDLRADSARSKGPCLHPLRPAPDAKPPALALEDKGVVCDAICKAKGVGSGSVTNLLLLVTNQDDPYFFSAA